MGRTHYGQTISWISIPFVDILYRVCIMVEPFSNLYMAINENVFNFIIKLLIFIFFLLYATIMVHENNLSQNSLYCIYIRQCCNSLCNKMHSGYNTHDYPSNRQSCGVVFCVHVSLIWVLIYYAYGVLLVFGEMRRRSIQAHRRKKKLL